MCTMYFFLVNIFIKLCNHHHYIISENFHHPSEKPPSVPISTYSLLLPPLPHSMAITNLLSVSIDLPILYIPHK